MKLQEVRQELQLSKQQLEELVQEITKSLLVPVGESPTHIVQAVTTLREEKEALRNQLTQKTAELEAVHKRASEMEGDRMDLYRKEKTVWEQERQRFVAEKLRLIQENEQLRQSKSTPQSTKPSPGVNPDTNEAIIRAIEADLQKAKGPRPSEDGWTVSDKVHKSPSKRARGSSGRTRKSIKTSGKNSPGIKDSPLRNYAGGSELDFWAFSK